MPTAAEVKASLIQSIEVFTPPGSTAQFKSNLRANLNAKSIEDLGVLLAQCVSEHREKTAAQIEEIRAQRHAESTMADLERGGPQRRDAATKAQAEQDRLTFEQAARTLRSFGQTDANLAIIKESLGVGFSLEQVKEFVETNGNLLSPPSTHEQNAWSWQDKEAAKQAEAQRIIALKNMSHEQLREEVRQAGQQAHQQAQQAEVQRQIAVREEKEQGFPPLPQVDDSGRTIDAGYVIRLSNAPITSADYRMFRHLCRRFGFAAVTRRLNGVG